MTPPRGAILANPFAVLFLAVALDRVPTTTMAAPAPVQPPAAEKSAEKPAGSAPSAPVPEPRDLATLWRDACLWEVGSNTEKVPEARRRLVVEGERSLDYLIPAKLDTKDTLVTRALNVVITGIGKSATARLVPCLDSGKADVRRNAADLLGALGATETAPAIAKLLADPDARLGALAALGQLKSPAAVPQIAALMQSDAPERVRYTAAATLGAVGGDDAIRALLGQLSSPVAPLRFAAQYALEALKANEALRSRLGDADLRVRLHAIAALGHNRDDASRADLLRLLGDPSPIVRGFAAEALAPMLDPSDRPILESRLVMETDPFVRGKLSLALAGR
jgi:hypothetical protein